MHTIDFKEKNVIVRGDMDVFVKDGKVDEPERLEILSSTLSQIIGKGANKILLVGHMGRPNGLVDGKVDPILSFRQLLPYFTEKFGKEILFVDHQPFDLYFEAQEQILDTKAKLTILENLRYWPQEEENNTTLAEQLAYGQDIFVNEAFASSHRAHASIVGIPKFVNSTLGPHFEKEVENLSKVVKNAQKPTVAIISGIKRDKLDYISGFKKFCDTILIGGRLPEFMPEEGNDPQVIVGRLNPDKEDLTLNSIAKFEEAIAVASTIILSGPPSNWEDGTHTLATSRIFEALTKSSAYKVAGGGDTIKAIHKFGIESTFDWISIGGGASLEFLANGTLPGIEAILRK